MPYIKTIIAQCPQCGEIAEGYQEVEEKFGFRYDGEKPQSWCRKCRSLGTQCNYTDCPFWGEEYPKCYYSIKCPLNDNN